METWLVRSACFVVSGCSDDDTGCSDESSSIRIWEVSLSGDASFSFMAVNLQRGRLPRTVLNWAWDAVGYRSNANSKARIFVFMGAKVRRRIGGPGKTGMRMGKL